VDARIGGIIPQSTGRARHFEALAPRIALDELGRIVTMIMIQVSSSSTINARIVGTRGATSVATVAAELSAIVFCQVGAIVIPFIVTTIRVNGTDSVFACEVAATGSTVWFTAVAHAHHEHAALLKSNSAAIGRVGRFHTDTERWSRHANEIIVVISDADRNRRTNSEPSCVESSLQADRWYVKVGEVFNIITRIGINVNIEVVVDEVVNSIEEPPASVDKAGDRSRGRS